jgi:hypothetical protein
MIKLLLNLVVFVIFVLVVIYFLPRNLKMSQLERLADFVPESIKEKAEDFLLTPAEKREKIILTLEAQLTVLENAVNPEAKEIIPTMRALIEKLKAENDELSFAEIAKEKLVEQFLKQEKTAPPTAP